MSRRLEAPGLDARANAALDLRNLDRAAATSVSRRNLVRTRKAGARATQADGADGGDVADLGFSTDTQAGKSLDAILAEFVMPEIADPSILKRSTAILQTFVEDIVPTLEGGDQLRDLARSLMAEEIAWRRDLLARMQEEIVR